MEIRQLEHFLAVAHHLNFTRAARDLHLVQSAVSTSVRALERELDGELFERSTRRVTLTTAGAALVPRARHILAEARAARDEVHSVTGLEHGTLALGTIQTVTWVDLPSLVADFHRAHDGIEVTLREAPVDELTDQLRAGRLDLALVAVDDDGVPPDLSTLASHAEELVLLTGPQHPLARRRRIAPRELANEPFIDFQCGTGLQTVVETLCDRSGLQRRLAFQVTQLGMVIELVTQGLGVAIVPRPVAARTTLPAITLRPQAAHRRVALVARTPRLSNPAARAILPALERAASGRSPTDTCT